MLRRTFLLLLAGLPASVALAGTKAVEEPTVAQGNTSFALDLYAKLRQREGNLFVSPFSISAALAMTKAGAGGDTLAEMANVLHLPPGEGTHTQLGELIRKLQTPDPKTGAQLAIANALWGQAGFPFRKEFLELTQKHYGAGLRQVNFRAVEQARQTINKWIEEQTKDRIKDLIKANDITPDTLLILTNAIYFKDAWQHEFIKGATQDEPFFAPDGEVKAPLMFVRKSFPYYAGEDFHAVELPYKGRSLGMVVLLPKAKDGLAALEAQLTPTKLNEWLGKMKSQDGEVRLPKFKIADRMMLADTLQELGMKLAFGDADFSGMSTAERLRIAKVIHQTYINVDEEGTEAAAATAVIMERLAAPIPREPFKFRADHPFVFLIRDRASGSILFMGRVVNPK